MCKRAILIGLVAIVASTAASLSSTSEGVSCQHPPLSTYPFCNESLSTSERVADLIGRMTLEEKISQLGTTAPGVPGLLEAYQWWSEGLHGVAFSPGVSFGGPVPAATSFPQIIGMGATFNMSLIAAMAEAISTEGRAMNNVGRAGHTYFTPNINVFRDPRWGRGQETPGESPYLNSQYVYHLVTNLQQGTDDRYLKMVATCKHFAAYDLEDSDGFTRYDFDANVTNQELIESYLPAFESCVRDAQAASIMCSYNAVNGVPSCAHGAFNNGIAREEWDFDGYIASDCGAVSVIQYNHNYTHTTNATCAAALGGGTDLNCGTYLQTYVGEAITNGSVSETQVDTSLSRFFGKLFALGYFDNPDTQPYMQIPPSAVNSPAHQQLALDAARQSVVLLNNPGNTLPFDGSSIKTIAVVGPNSNATTTMQGNYYGQAPYLISPVAGFEGLGVEVNWAFGCGIADNNTEGFANATAAAAASDATVLVIGLDQTQEAEGHDRVSIALPGVQWQLVEEVVSAARGPVAVVVMTGGPPDLTPLVNMSLPALWVGYPGQSGGQAIAEAIFGVINPGGRLPYTVYPAEYANEILMSDMSFRTAPGRGYRFYTGYTPFPFGTGLSYTTFTYVWGGGYSVTGGESEFVIDTAVFAREGARAISSSTSYGGFSVNVTNTGKVAGDTVVLAYMIPINNTNAPLKQLFGFERVSLQPGESAVVFFAPTAREFALVDARGDAYLVPGVYDVVLGESEAVRVELVGKRVLVKARPAVL